MMYPPIFSLANVAGVQAQLKTGSGPLRFYPFSQAPQPGTAFYALPYAVWQSVTGSPENYLGDVPDIDSFGIQVDAYGATGVSVHDVAEALRDALEPNAYITAWLGESKEAETGMYRFSFTVEFLTPR